MFGRRMPAIVTCVVLVPGLVACAGPATTAPTAVPEAPTVVVTSVVTLTPEPTPAVVTATPEPTPVVVTVVVTETPIPPTETPTPPSETPLPGPRVTPTSAGPLSFPEPRNLDHWQPLADGEYECTIIVRITGGAPPYTVHHDLDAFTTWETDPAIVFKAQACSAIVHTITVESADGQAVAHDYAIPAPWCD
jgi:hypothetical protein